MVFNMMQLAANGTIGTWNGQGGTQVVIQFLGHNISGLPQAIVDHGWEIKCSCYFPIVLVPSCIWGFGWKWGLKATTHANIKGYVSLINSSFVWVRLKAVYAALQIAFLKGHITVNQWKFGWLFSVKRINYVHIENPKWADPISTHGFWRL